MATLLLELFSEEIPSRMQRDAASQLARRVSEGLKTLASKDSALTLEVSQYVSPRHLAVIVKGLPLVQADYKEERKGPKVGAPEQAMKGFLTAVGLTAEQCEQRDGYYYASIEKKGQPVATVAKEIIESALSAFGWPKSMRWGNRPLQWVRPLHRIVALLDDQIIPVQFAHLTASNVTEGHRFLSVQPITLGHANDYVKALADAQVMVDYAARRGAISTAVHALAETAGLKVNPDEALLDEVTGLVEWPVPLLCTFDAKFLDLPPEVLISEMKNHQRYFALLTAEGKLSNQFITVANMVTKDAGAKVKEGNARVVRARLADGEFYWEQDKKKSLQDWAVGLKDVVFHAKVGMMNEKVERIEKLAVAIAQALGHPPEAANAASTPRQRGKEEISPPAGGGSNSPLRIGGGGPTLDDIQRTALLCKADLTSGMVGEFPELQGIMGRYYATAQGEKQDIADAIRDHYKPVGANDSVPETQLAAIVGTADKLDSILSLFKAGEKPTGSKDPLALRRAALGILRTALERQWNLDLAKLGATDEVVEFFRDRLKNVLKDEGIRHDIIEASISLADQGFNALAIAKRARTLTAWLNTPGGKDALAAIKRSMNILAAEEKKAKTQFKPAIAASLTQPSEKMLQQLLQQKAGEATDLNALAAPINQFFTDVLVTEPEFRDARLGLLAQVRATASSIADFSKIEG